MKELAQKISEIAARARTEEDLKMGVEPLIRERLGVQDGIEVQPEYEKQTGFRGRRDAVYGHLTIEYKKPGELAGEDNINRAAKQLARYLEKASDDATEEALKRVAGVCIDGKLIFFLRYWPAELTHARPLRVKRQLSLFNAEKAEGGFQLLGPYPVTSESLEELFRYLSALRRRPLSPEPLAEEFGPGSQPAQALVGAFYQALTST
ncbi:hypothetical protein HKBW3C_01740, partial [Candidatus Hakubella thermalkaliphila]